MGLSHQKRSEAKYDTIKKDYQEYDNKNIKIYIKKLKQKDSIIAQLKYMLKQEKEKTLFYKNTFKNINREYTEFLQGKDKLKEKIYNIQNENNKNREKINSLKDTITTLQNDNIKKENKIASLKSEIIDQEDRISSLVEEIKNLQIIEKDLNSELELYKCRDKNSIFSKIFNI